MSKLFTPFKIKDLTIKNRIAIPPMCQYSAVDGMPNDWHLVHYPSLARGGAGLVIVESTGVAPEGRISAACLGIWNDEQAKEHAKIAASIKKTGAIAGIQINHAGLKANSEIPWKGGQHIKESDPRYWQTVAPSAVPFGTKELWQVPQEMTIADIKRVQDDFVAAAIRALEAGYQWLELHFSHGYLGSQFFSIHNNKRTDEYGGSAENRGRFLLETLQKVRKVWPENLPLTARFGMIEYDGRDEETLSEAIELAKKFKTEGLDFINVSMGFTTPDAKIPWGTIFMPQIAQRVKQEVGIPVATAWGLGHSDIAEKAATENDLDLVMVGRSHLANPHWPFAAANELKIDNPQNVLPAQYGNWVTRYK